MASLINVEGIATAIVIAIIFAFVKLFRDVDQIKVAHKYEVTAIRTEIKPVVDWYVKTSMDALKIATNPTSERLTELAARYMEHVNEGKPMLMREKQELIDGLREVMNDKHQYADKRQSASLSLRFIESREGLVSKAANTNH